MEQRNPTIRFQRIDADVTDTAKEEVAEEDQETFKKTSDSLIEIFRKELGNDKLDVKIAKLKDENVASMITLSEQSRRMQEMMKMYGMNDMGIGSWRREHLNPECKSSTCTVCCRPCRQREYKCDLQTAL